MRFKAALLLATGLTAVSAPALAIPVLFGGANAPGANGAPLTDAAPGQTVTVTGPLLQLRLADGSTVIAPQGTQFTVSSDVPASIALVTGSLRVHSAGAPITVTRGGTAVTTTGGVFLAAAQGQGLAGRVNQGAAQVMAGGQSRSFAAGGGYVATAGGISGTFTPPVASAPALAASQAAQSGPGGFSAADPRSASGAGATLVAAAQSSGFPISSGGTVLPPDENDGDTDGNGTGNNDTGNNGTGNNGTGNNTGNNGTGNNNTGNNNTGGTPTQGGTLASYGGTPPVKGTVALTGTEKTGQIVTYAGDWVGLDTRAPASVTIGASGELNGYKASADEYPERNTNESLDRATAGGLSIERWSGGVTGGRYYASPNTERTSQQGLHLAYGAPAAAVPAQGLATYKLAAATKPTLGFGGTAPGTMTAGSLGILFSAKPKVGVDFSVTMPGDTTYSVKTAGGAAAPSQAVEAADLQKRYFRLFNLTATGTGIACSGNCDAALYGILGGANSETVGMSYEIGSISGTDATGRRNTVTGAAIFTQDGFDAGQGGVTTHPAVSSGAITAPLRGVSGLYGIFYVTPKQGFTTFLDPTKIAVNAQGLVESFTAGADVYARNDNVVAELFGTKYVQIGRWNGGTVKKGSGDYFAPDGWQGLPYVIGIPIAKSQLPTTGLATYALKGATAPMLTSGDTQPGSFTGSLGVDFSTTNSAQGAKVGIDGKVTVNTAAGAAVTYDIGTPGGAANPSGSPVTYNGASITGFYDVAKPASGDVVCGTACAVSVNGMLAGPSGRDAGLGYRIGSGNTQIVGAAAFARTDDPALANKDVGIRGLLMAPGGNTIPGSYGVQNLVNNPVVTYTGDGKGVQGIKDTQNFAPDTAEVVDRGTGGSLTWSRWSNGTATAVFGGATPTLGANQGMHQIIGEPATNLPTSGKADYTLAGYTKPTSTDNSVAPGTLTGAMAVQFGTTQAGTGVGLDLHVAIGGHTYNIATTGGAANPGQSQLKLNGDVFGAAYGQGATINVNAGGVACPGANCRAEVSGFLSGFGGASAGLGYTISEFGSPNNPGAVQGTAAFVKAP